MNKEFYRRYVKRFLDIIISVFGLVILSPVFLIISILVKIKLGGPVIFTQKRPGLNEKIFTLYKFRTMTDTQDHNGNLLPDSHRLTNFGKVLRKTSLDEIPQLINIIKGEMSIVGPRPLLVKDLVFMSLEQRKRHSVLPGITGLAQISGRNNITWEDKLGSDLEYLGIINLFEDLRIVFMTAWKVLKREGISSEGMDTSEDFGDYLLRVGKVTKQDYDEKVKLSKSILGV